MSYEWFLYQIRLSYFLALRILVLMKYQNIYPYLVICYRISMIDISLRHHSIRVFHHISDSEVQVQNHFSFLVALIFY